jgi:hypothetical protein
MPAILRILELDKYSNSTRNGIKLRQQTSMINTKQALAIQIITFILLVILASEQYQYQQRNRTIIRADVIVLSVPITPTTSATPIPNAQESPSTTKPTNAKITILATQSTEAQSTINNTLVIEVLSAITAALSIFSILLGICIRRINKRKQAYKRHVQAPSGNVNQQFSTPIDLNNIDVQTLAQQLSELQRRPPPTYKAPN